MTERQPEALRLAAKLDYHAPHRSEREAANELRRLYEVNQELIEALKSTGLFLHHCWCDVQMNEYSFEKLNLQMEIVDAIIAKVKGEQYGI